MNNGKNSGGKRRKQHGRAPSTNQRRRRRGKNESIEEQLRAQRKRQALEQQSSKSKAPSASIGNYRFDAERNAYFPAESFPSTASKKRQAKTNSKTTRQHGYMHCANPKCVLNPTGISSQSLRYSMETSSSATRQHHLRSLLAGRLLKQGMQVVPTTSSFARDGETRLWSMLPPLISSSNDDSSMALDFVCKTRLHPSARTFDVYYNHSKPNELPSIATLVDGGSQVTFGHEPEVLEVSSDDVPAQSHLNDDVCLRISPLADSGESEPHAIRFPSNTIQTPVHYSFCNISQLSSQPNKSVVRCWSGRDNRISHIDLNLPFLANDLAYDASNTKVGVAPNCIERKGSQMALLDLEQGVCWNYAQDSPRSDALCIENSDFCGVFLTGHRNGWLSMVDIRRDSAVSLAPPDSSAGSLTRILSMESHRDPFKILTKHSFGCCFLWDVRMMGKDKRATPLVEMRVPKSLIQATKSSCCNGVAVDPTGSIVIAPFVLNSSDQSSCFAFWSLSSGAFVGYRPISPPAGPSGGMPHCELSSTIASAWKPMAPSARSGDMMVESDENAWGLWFKYGLPLTDNGHHETPNFISSIHHVTFPGRMMDN